MAGTAATPAVGTGRAGGEEILKSEKMKKNYIFFRCDNDCDLECCDNDCQGRECRNCRNKSGSDDDEDVRLSLESCLAMGTSLLDSYEPGEDSRGGSSSRSREEERFRDLVEVANIYWMM